MIHTETVHEHLVLRSDHVVVVIMRKFHPQTIRRLRGVALTDVIGKNQIVARDVQRLARSEENVGENRIEKWMAIAASAMQKKDGIVDVAGRVAMRTPQRKVSELQFGQTLSCSE